MDERSERIAQRFELPMMVSALLMIPVIAIQQSDASEELRVIADVLNWTIWLAFVAELVVMLMVVPNKRRWLREHPLEVAIVLVTPPFLPPSLEAARIFRLLRLIVLLRAAFIARRLFSLEGVRDAAVLALLTLLGGGAAFAAVEPHQHLSAWDGVWWAATTVTTVGYGDISPETDAGRVIAITVMVVGIGFVALLTAAAAERFMRRSERAVEVEEQLKEIAARLAAIEQNQRK